ncbi:hypothetical protein KSS87_018733, partial [Heliosperma pusillum]
SNSLNRFSFTKTSTKYFLHCFHHSSLFQFLLV